MRRRMCVPVLATLMAATACLAGGSTQRVRTDALTGWRPLWTRQAKTGTATVDETVRHGDVPSVRVEHTGPKDWSLVRRQEIAVEPGDILEISAWMKVQGQGAAHIGAATYDSKGKVHEWMLGQRSQRGTHDWRHLQSRMVVPAGISKIQPRVTGDGPAIVWIEGFSCRKTTTLAALRNKDLPETITIRNPALAVTFNTRDATVAVTDLRCKQTWTQKAISHDVVVRDAKADKTGMRMTLYHVPSGLDIQVNLRFDERLGEFSLKLSANGDLPAPLSWPAPFVTGKGTCLVVPLNEGISYPVDDASIEPMRLIGYGGHGLCMSFWGVTDGKTGQMAILETPDNAAVRIERSDKTGGNLYVQPEWDSQMGTFGPVRRMRYIFLDRGGYVAMCKQYRRYARKIGLLKTLAQKRDANRNIALLAGAVDVWCWEKDPLLVVADMKQAGIDHILWSRRGKPEDIAAMNRAGVLTSRYDIYQDVMNPAMFGKLQGIHPDWPEGAWPKDIILDEAGNWLHGWEVETKDGTMYPCGVMCDKQALKYAQKRIPADLAQHPYRCRFIDTATAAPWRECYSPDHPMTRSESRLWRMELLRYVSKDCKLVTGSETGHDAAVPYVDYFEGMMSLGPYRCHNAGRNMSKILDQAPPQVKKFQVGWKYRLPLWELVYHDCVVSYWYWGDYSNKIPSVWDDRDLFNALYGTPAMFMFDWQFWRAHRSRFVQKLSRRLHGSRQDGLRRDDRSPLPDAGSVGPADCLRQRLYGHG